MGKKHVIRVDPQKCTGCGLCLTVCPSRCLAIRDGKAAAVNDQSIGCGHCADICPEGAVSVETLDGWAEAYATFKPPDPKWVAPGETSATELAALMRSRRSFRSYADRPVSRDALEDLTRLAVTAPSGTNCQDWTFTILPDRPSVLSLGAAVSDFFRKLNALAANPLVRLACRAVGKRELEAYYREYYASVAAALADWDERGLDRLFHGAPAAIVVGSRPGGSCPAEDALLATQNMLLGAHALGLGTCLIGYAVEAMRHDRRVRKAAGLPNDETPRAVVAVGWPKERYRRLASRQRPLIRYVQGPSANRPDPQS